MHRLLILAAGVGIALAVAGCQAHGSAQASRPVRSSTAAPSTPGPSATLPAPPATASAALPVTTGTVGAAGPTLTVSVRQPDVSLTEACGQYVLLSYIRTQATDLPTGVQRVKIYNCVKGYARLYAVPNLDSGGSQPDGDQFFLQFIAGQWQVLARGNGIDCGDNNPKLTDACAAFA
jgi:hypothetical protein